MTTRLLPRSEWHKLAHTELAQIAPLLGDEARVLVVEDERDHVIGCWAFFPVIHAEGVYIAPEHRKKTAVARHLLRGMRRTVREMGASVVSTAAITDDVRGILEGLGAVALPGTHYAMKVEPCQQQ